ncbi:aldolase, partial [Candidatus Parcubacteria bacterium]|nr:aldolase [Candidatus Parcubacteria bacterium]
MTDIGNKVLELCLNNDLNAKQALHAEIMEVAKKGGAYPASIDPFYTAVGNGQIKPTFTVPAINLRTLTYDTARNIFSVARKKDVGCFIFEIARSEITYTDQIPLEFSGTIMGAAVTAGWKGPVFIQGDHYQVNLTKYNQNPYKEIGAIKELTFNSVKAGVYNIDTDCSTLVDLKKPATADQQYLNALITAHLTDYVRMIQPRGIQVSVGAEIGEIGGKNSTVEELDAFMTVYKDLVKSSRIISKMSVQTGAVHAGE